MFALLKWVEVFLEGKDHFFNTTVYITSISVWIKGVNEPVAPMRLSLTIKLEDDSIIVVVRLDKIIHTKWSSQLAKHKKKFIAFEKFRLPTQDVMEWDSTQYPNGAMWRDTLRRQLQFETLQVDFRSIMIDNKTETPMFSLLQPEIVLS